MTAGVMSEVRDWSGQESRDAGCQSTWPASLLTQNFESSVDVVVRLLSIVIMSQN